MNPPPSTLPTVAQRDGTPPLPTAMRGPGSITDFITDGSLAALCEELTRLTGVEVWLRDAQGRRIVRTDEPPYWALREAPPAAAQSPDGPITRGAEVVVPLEVEGQSIGAIVLGPGAPRLPE